MSPGGGERGGQRAHVLQRRAAAALDTRANGPEPDAGGEERQHAHAGELEHAQPHGEPSTHAIAAPARLRDASNP